MPASSQEYMILLSVCFQMRRRSSSVFAGKQGFITLRDLFRWAERYRLAACDSKEHFFDWDQLLADNGERGLSLYPLPTYTPWVSLGHQFWNLMSFYSKYELWVSELVWHRTMALAHHFFFPQGTCYSQADVGTLMNAP